MSQRRHAYAGDSVFFVSVVLSQRSIDSFRRLYAEQYGEEIDPGTARLAAERLVGLFELLAGWETVSPPAGLSDSDCRVSGRV